MLCHIQEVSAPRNPGAQAGEKLAVKGNPSTHDKVQGDVQGHLAMSFSCLFLIIHIPGITTKDDLHLYEV